MLRLYRYPYEHFYPNIYIHANHNAHTHEYLHANFQPHHYLYAIIYLHAHGNLVHLHGHQ